MNFSSINNKIRWASSSCGRVLAMDEVSVMVAKLDRALLWWASIGSWSVCCLGQM